MNPQFGKRLQLVKEANSMEVRHWTSNDLAMEEMFDRTEIIKKLDPDSKWVK